MQPRTYRYRSLFWPLVLILAGVIALLVNGGALSVDRIYLLFDLWPVILIVIGLELIVRRTVKGVAGDIAAALIVVIALVGALAYVTVAPNRSGTYTLDASAPAAQLTEGSVQIDVGAANITVREGSTSDLYRAHVEYSGSKSDVTVVSSNGTVNIRQSSSRIFASPSRQFVLDLQLDPDVAWTIAENTAAATNKINLPNVHVAGVTIDSGASTTELSLGSPSGIVPVEVNGGALNVHVHRPSGTEASVRASGGLVNVDADGKSLHAIGDVSYETPGFSGARDGYRIGVSGGTCNVTLDSSTASD